MALDNPHGFEFRGSATDYLCIEIVVTSGQEVYIGDAVEMNSGTVDQAAAAATFTGVSLSRVTGDGTLKALVCVDPQALYTVQVSNGGSQIAATDILSTFDLVTGATPGADVSTMELEDVSTVSAQFVLLKIESGASPAGGTLPTYGSDFIEAVVRPNVAKLESVYQI